MANKQTWVDEIVGAFKALDGAARYDDLYEYIQRTTTRKLTREWKATIRRTIEDHSSDSKNFRSSDLFKRHGHGFWGLREAPSLDDLIEGRLTRSAKSIVDEVLQARPVPEGTSGLVFVREHWRRWPSGSLADISILLDRLVFQVVDGWVTDESFELKLSKGLILRVPFSWYPKLAAATKEERRAVEFGEFGAYWKALGFEVLVPEVLTSAAGKVAKL
jgi:hypothetical protein